MRSKGFRVEKSRTFDEDSSGFSHDDWQWVMLIHCRTNDKFYFLLCSDRFDFKAGLVIKRVDRSRSNLEKIVLELHWPRIYFNISGSAKAWNDATEKRSSNRSGFVYSKWRDGIMSRGLAGIACYWHRSWSLASCVIVGIARDCRRHVVIGMAHDRRHRVLSLASRVIAGIALLLAWRTIAGIVLLLISPVIAGIACCCEISFQ